MDFLKILKKEVKYYSVIVLYVLYLDIMLFRESFMKCLMFKVCSILIFLIMDIRNNLASLTENLLYLKIVYDN